MEDEEEMEDDEDDDEGWVSDEIDGAEVEVRPIRRLFDLQK